jgi:hypothetical protein
MPHDVQIHICHADAKVGIHMPKNVLLVPFRFHEQCYHKLTLVCSVNLISCITIWDTVGCTVLYLNVTKWELRFPY